MFTFPVTFFGAGSATRTFLQSETPINAIQTVYTFSNVNIGPATADRYVVCIIGCYVNVPSRTLNSVTIGGNAATIVVNSNAQVAAAATCITGIAILNVTAGTTANVVATFNNNMLVCHCHTYVINNLTMASPTSPTTKSTTNNASGTTLSDTIATVANSLLIAGVTSAASAGSFSFTGVALDSNTTALSVPSGCGSAQNLSANAAFPYSSILSSSTTVTALAAATWS